MSRQKPTTLTRIQKLETIGLLRKFPLVKEGATRTYIQGNKVFYEMQTLDDICLFCWNKTTLKWELQTGIGK